MDIRLKKLIIQNFKGIKKLEVNLNDNTKINGRNASGKSTVVDAIMWLLFNKNSAGAEKFNVRTLDENGDKIHNIEIVVSGVFEIDGEEVTIEKTQKENWVKKRGSQNPVLQGNVNSYEIDGYPKSEKDFKSYVSNLIDEGLFKMLTSPMYFTSLKWQEQREILMRLVSDVSDVDLANKIGGFEDIIGELKKAPGTDDIQKKYGKAKNDLTKRLKEIPVRIDELENSKVSIDESSLKEKLDGLDNEISSIEKMIEAGIVDTSSLTAELNATIAKIGDIERKIDGDSMKRFDDIRTKLFDLELKNRDLTLSISSASMSIDENNKYIADS